jgi:hypothetical protein
VIEFQVNVAATITVEPRAQANFFFHLDRSGRPLHTYWSREDQPYSPAELAAGAPTLEGDEVNIKCDGFFSQSVLADLICYFDRNEEYCVLQLEAEDLEDGNAHLSEVE